MSDQRNNFDFGDELEDVDEFSDKEPNEDEEEVISLS